MESRLLDQEEPALQRACQEYKVRFLERNLMRMPLCWNLPNPDENEQFTMPQEDVFLQEVLEKHLERHFDLFSMRYNGGGDIRGVDAAEPWKRVTKDQLRFAVAELHYGMASLDPIMMITFHDKKYQKKDYSGDPDANPHRRKLCLFWNPPAAELEDSATLKRPFLLSLRALFF